MSRLALGTVQFGMPYGVANTTGQPSPVEARAILDAAFAGGIEDLDTASGYGSAETVLGSWEHRSRTRIVSKFSPGEDDAGSPRRMLDAFEASLARLDVARLHGYLLHDASLLFQPGWMEILGELRDGGRVGRVGVSTYAPEEAMAAARDPRIGIVQVPYSILDHRLDDCGFFELARERDLEVWTRSAFVQGLLLMDPDRIPPALRASIPLRRRIEEIAARHGFGLGEAALLHALSRPGVDRVLVGVETVEQVHAHLRTPDAIDRFGPCRDEIASALRGQVDPFLVSPQKWSKP